MGIVKKISNMRVRLSGKLEDCLIKDNLNCMYLGGFIVGSVGLAGLTEICEGKYFDGVSKLVYSGLTHKFYFKYVKRDIAERGG